MEVLGFPETSPAGIVLQYLRRNGQATIKDLETVLGVSTTAVREHLFNLQSQGLLSNTTMRYGPGRPRLVYRLTEKAQKLFPKQYDLLINVLLQEIAAEEHGDEKVERLLQRVSARIAHDYADRISSADLHARLIELRSMLEDQGIPSDIQPTGNGIRIYSCPYLDVAKEHAEVCAMDRQMFENILGKKLTQEHSIRNGDFHCCFHVGEADQERVRGDHE